MTPFSEAVHEVVRSLPEGTCASYGEVATEAGRPGAARGVGRVLADSEGLPWWRVVRADGTLPKGADQARRLEAEGVSIIGGRARPAGRGTP